MSSTAIILAAGRSTRMKSRRPKPLMDVCGKPMLGWILDACFAAGVDRAIVVVGHGKDEVIARFGEDARVEFVEQREQLGTGHAVRVCEPALEGVSGDVFILAGDTPLVRPEILTALHDAHQADDAAASMATAMIDDPFGYGRVMRDENGEFVAIIEQIDATPEQAEIREVFPSFYCVKVDELRFALARLKNNNRKSEYYLTDIYAILRDAGRKITAVQAMTPADIIAPNTRQQLAEADVVMQGRIQQSLRDSGVSIPSPEQTYIEAGVSVGPDTTILPFSFVGRGSSIGADCTIGPFACLAADSVVPDGSTVANNAGLAR
jgi:bifunctional UDP-N-acetylglucosamine pyrophosphorylase / glucosamine-1-phosphate N-acetyltransferase